jgi:hypothetical protein
LIVILSAAKDLPPITRSMRSFAALGMTGKKRQEEAVDEFERS